MPCLDENALSGYVYLLFWYGQWQNPSEVASKYKMKPGLWLELVFSFLHLLHIAILHLDMSLLVLVVLVAWLLRD